MIDARPFESRCHLSQFNASHLGARRAMARPRMIAWRAIVAMAVLSFGATAAEAQVCDDGSNASIWFFPQSPQPGDQVRVLAVATDHAIDELAIVDEDGRRRILPGAARGGPPWSREGSFDFVARRPQRVEASRAGRVIACRETTAGARIADGWDRATQALYAAWIEALFDAPPEEDMSFPSLEPVLRNSERNLLHDYFGAGEDRRLPATPDCADLPYFLRTYFAWKLGLPFAYRACSRGSASAPPRCGAAVIEQTFAARPASPEVFRNVTRRLIDTVHSGSARTGLTDNQTDFYPVALERDALWPGTVYADPYGHVLILVKWVPPAQGRSGMLLAVDAQPDNSVTRKRFWEGTFLFSGNIRSAGPGFKAFRPLARARDGSGPVRLLSNDALLDDPRFPAFSYEQARLDEDEFYARIAQLINPQGLDPELAYQSTLDALVEQLATRVTSIDNGEAYFRRNPRSVIAMPAGAAIFETVGPWEDYATPSRDMRLLIAMNVLARLPDRIVLHPELFLLNGRSPEMAREDIEQLHRRSIGSRTISYTRSDGSPQQLSIAEIFERQPAFEVGYNPNDCVEMRWGAATGSAEGSSCRRHAPPDQRSRMESYRAWFRETRRPPR